MLSRVNMGSELVYRLMLYEAVTAFQHFPNRQPNKGTGRVVNYRFYNCALGGVFG